VLYLSEHFVNEALAKEESYILDRFVLDMKLSFFYISLIPLSLFFSVTMLSLISQLSLTLTLAL